MNTLEFYRERAAECRQQAEDANLANVRERCLSAATAWDGMAQRIERTQVFRDDNAAAKTGPTEAPAADNAINSKSNNERNDSDQPQGVLDAAPAGSPAAS